MNQAIESGCVVTGQQHNSGASVNEVWLRYHHRLLRPKAAIHIT